MAEFFVSPEALAKSGPKPGQNIAQGTFSIHSVGSWGKYKSPTAILVNAETGEQVQVGLKQFYEAASTQLTKPAFMTGDLATGLKLITGISFQFTSTEWAIAFPTAEAVKKPAKAK